MQLNRNSNLRLAIWNANDLSNHYHEVELFLKTNFIDIFLISETHFTNRTYFKINGFDLIATNHPDNRAHAGACILIKSNIEYDLLEPIQIPSIQAAGVKIKFGNVETNIFAVYFPPRHILSCRDYCEFFNKVGSRFLVGGDFNAKHPWWGSRLINPKGRELYKCITHKHYNTLSTGEPTYWPSDPHLVPDLMDFIVYKGIHSQLLDIMSSEELSSDHSPLIVNYNATVQMVPHNKKLLRNETNITAFQNWINSNVNLKIPIKCGADLDEAVENFTNLIHAAALHSNPPEAPKQKNVHISAEIRELLHMKRRLRKAWQVSRNPTDKTILNRAAADLKEKLKLFKNKAVSEFIGSPNMDQSNHHRLWKAVRYLKRPAKRSSPIKKSDNTWCRTDKRLLQIILKPLSCRILIVIQTYLAQWKNQPST